MYWAIARFISRTRKSQWTFARGLKSCVKSMVKHSPNTMKTLAEPSLSRYRHWRQPTCSRPYTLPLKHYEWVQREIESLEWAGVIKKSTSNWASPIVIVPKKSAPGEPPKRRLCIDFRKVNELQQEVLAEGKKIGQISLH